METLLKIESFVDATPSIVILLVVFVFGLTFFHILERFFPPVHATYKTGPKRKGYLADFTASVIDGPVMYAITKMGFYSLIIASPVFLTEGMSTWPWLLQFAVFFLVNDFGRYWLHRWHHESDFLWRFHRVHHTVKHMDAMSVFRVHMIEAVMKYGLIVLPFHFAHCAKTVIILYSTIDILKGFWHHANLRTRIGWLNYIFNSAELHWWHHSTEAKGQLANYGSTLSIWDWIFGTAYYSKGEWPQSIGVEGMDNFPERYHELLGTAVLTDEEAIERYGNGPINESNEDEADIRFDQRANAASKRQPTSTKHTAGPSELAPAAAPEIV